MAPWTGISAKGAMRQMHLKHMGCEEVSADAMESGPAALRKWLWPNFMEMVNPKARRMRQTRSFALARGACRPVLRHSF